MGCVCALLEIFPHYPQLRVNGRLSFGAGRGYSAEVSTRMHGWMTFSKVGRTPSTSTEISNERKKKNRKIVWKTVCNGIGRIGSVGDDNMFYFNIS